MRYDYEITGAADDGQTWHVEGEVEVDKPGMFMSVPVMAMGEAFEQLTEGRAQYGKPGLGCDGPYRITRMLIKEALQ